MFDVERPHIVEAELPHADAAIFLLDEPPGPPRVVVLTDPRVTPERLARVVAAATLLHDERDELPAGVPVQRSTSVSEVIRRALGGTAAVLALTLSGLTGDVDGPAGGEIAAASITVAYSAA